jgi:hypothetical protein
MGELCCEAQLFFYVYHFLFEKQLIIPNEPKQSKKSIVILAAEPNH